jgi:hypothetical protein
MFVVCDKDLLPELNALEQKSGIVTTANKQLQKIEARAEARKAYKVILKRNSKWRVIQAAKRKRE